MQLEECPAWSHFGIKCRLRDVDVTAAVVTVADEPQTGTPCHLISTGLGGALSGVDHALQMILMTHAAQ
jgi:hypothetical protein